MTLCTCQAHFRGGRNAWQRLGRALKAPVDAWAFDQMRGTESFPFRPDEHKQIAAEVIDLWRDEVVRVMSLGQVTCER